MRDWREYRYDPPSRARDLKLLARVLEFDVTDAECAAFTDMICTLTSGRQTLLTVKQRLWGADVLDRYAPQYENLVSSGMVSSETKVETIPLLKPENLPKKPPPRRTE